jgi:RNA polymerase sigma-70 factor (ECF subfamily)
VSVSGSTPRVAVVAPTFDDIYAQCFDMVWCLARRLGARESSIDDVVQDVFVIVHRRLGDYNCERAPLRSWIYGITVRVVRDHRRSFRRKDAKCISLSDGTDSPLADSAPAPSELVERREAWKLVCALLDELDEGKRELLVLSELEGMTVPEIAGILGLNVQTIYSRLRVARRAFDEAHARHLARAPRRRR